VERKQVDKDLKSFKITVSFPDSYKAVVSQMLASCKSPRVLAQNIEYWISPRHIELESLSVKTRNLHFSTSPSDFNAGIFPTLRINAVKNAG